SSVSSFALPSGCGYSLVVCCFGRNGVRQQRCVPAQTHERLCVLVVLVDKPREFSDAALQRRELQPCLVTLPLKLVTVLLDLQEGVPGETGLRCKLIVA